MLGGAVGIIYSCEPVSPCQVRPRWTVRLAPRACAARLLPRAPAHRHGRAPARIWPNGRAVAQGACGRVEVEVAAAGGATLPAARDDPTPRNQPTTPPAVVGPQACCRAFNRPQRQAGTTASTAAATAAAPHGRAHHRARHRTTHRQHRKRVRTATRLAPVRRRRRREGLLLSVPQKSCGSREETS